MTQFKQDPYEYITPDNYELIRAALIIGMKKGKSPLQIAVDMVETTKLPQPICFAIVQSELVPSLEALEEKKKKKDE